MEKQYYFKEGVIISELKNNKKPMTRYIADIIAAHPFYVTIAACFFCMTIAHGKTSVSMLGAFIPASVMSMTGIFGAACISADAPKRSRNSLFWSLTAVSIALSLIFMYLLTTSTRPPLVILNVGIAAVSAAAVYFFASKKITTKRLILLMFILGFLIRLAYIMAVSIHTQQHDAGSAERMQGHLGYIAYLLNNAHLPDMDVREVNQFYHPPLHHILAAIWIAVQQGLGIEPKDAYENIQLLTMMYSCFCMILSYKIFKQLGLKGKGLIVSFAIVAFCPTFYILGGCVNNDILCVTLMLGAVLNTFYWYKSRKMSRIICIAVCVGCAMMAKLSGWMTAPAIAFVFIYVFFKNLKEWKKYLAQYAAFICVCAPLGLWWGIRNYITHKVPIAYIIKLPENSSQYIGNIPVTKRLFDFNPRQFADVGDQFTMYDGAYNEYNPLIALFKTSMFDELFIVRTFPKIAGINQVLFWSAVILGIIGFAMMIYVFFNDKELSGVHKVFTGIFYFTLMGSYYIFCIKFPHVCTENIRYAVPVIVIGAYFVGRLMQKLNTSISKKPSPLKTVIFTVLLSITVIYGSMSVLVYDVIFLS